MSKQVEARTSDVSLDTMSEPWEGKVEVYYLLINHEKKALAGPAGSVRVHPGVPIAHLKDKVKKKETVILVASRMLTVWRCEDSNTDFVDVEPDERDMRLNEVFSSNEKKVERLGLNQKVRQFPNETLLIEVPGEKDIELFDEARDTAPDLPAITRRDKTLSTFKASMSVDNFDGIKKAHDQLFTGRMSDRYGHPVALFHQELALLQQRLQALDTQAKTGQDWETSGATAGRPGKRKELTNDQLENARTYFDKFRQPYGSEANLWLVTQTFWEYIFGKTDMQEQRLSSEGVRSSKGVNRADAVWGKYAIYEGKNAFGLAGDPSLQAAVRYGKFCGNLEGRFKHSKLPVILIGNSGNVFEVSIAVCLEEVLVDKIFHFEILNSVHHDETILKLALIASALKACADKLRAEYKDLEKTSTGSPVEEETWHLPCPSAAVPSPNTLIPAVRFTGKLNRNNQKLTKPEGKNSEMRSLFLAVYLDQEVVVKFSVRYGVGAHRAVADGKYAPKLLTCEQVIGGQQMVVMERVDGKPMDQERQHSLPRSVFVDLENALKILHGKGLVFGDLRDTNVMITKSDGKVRTMLVDFNWTDLEGKGRYPTLINRDLIGTELDSDIHPNGFMYKKHDEYALGKLILRYCEDTEYREAKCKELEKSGD